MSAEPGSLGKALHQLRVARGIKAINLAAVTKIDNSVISAFEHGIRKPGHLHVARLIRALGYNLAVLQFTQDFDLGLEEFEIEEWVRP